MADFRIILPTIYEDEKVRGMKPRVEDLWKLRLNDDLTASLIGACRHSIFLFAINNVRTSDTGIYELSRGSVEFHKETPLQLIEDALGMSKERAKMFFGKKQSEDLTAEEEEFSKGYFNREKPFLLQYDTEHHIFFIKSFFKHNSAYLSTPEKLAVAIKKDYQKTHDKCPKFWAEFSKINHKRLRKAQKDLTTGGKSFKTYHTFFEQLFALENQYFPPEKPLGDLKIVSAEKMQELTKILGRI